MQKQCSSCGARVEAAAERCPECGADAFVEGNGASEQAARLVEEGAQLRRAGDLKRAREVLQEAVELDPDSPEAQAELGFVLLELERPDAALPHLERALKRKPLLEGLSEALERARAAHHKAAGQESSAAPASDGTADERSSGCFVATACYGTPEAPQVRALRRWRDEVLLPTPAGRLFVKHYYRRSPAVAAVLRRRPGLRALVRAALVAPLARLVGRGARG